MLKLGKPKRAIALTAATVALACGATIGLGGTASADAGSILQNGWSGKCMAVGNWGNIYNGVPILEYGCIGAADQGWGVSYSNSHQGWFYFYNGKDNNYCLTYTPGTTNQLTLNQCGYQGNNGTQSQLWRTGTYWVNGQAYPEYIDYADGNCISVPGNNQGDLAPINVWPCGGYLDQRWYLGGYN